MKSLAVLMATYHRDDAALFENALLSILNQKLPFEYKLNIYLGIDGAIGHELEEVIVRNCDKVYRIIRSPINEGLAATLNKLIMALGDEAYVFRMDADDISMPNRFAKQLDFLQKYPDVDIVGTDIIEFNRDSNSRRIVHFALDHTDAVSKISRRVPVAHPTVCFRRRVFSIVENYPVISGNEDIAMWFKCMSAGLRFGNVHEELLLFSINSNFWARRSFSKAISEFKCYTKGIWALDGVTWKYIYPIARLLMRISPKFVSKILYNSKVVR